MSNPGKADIGAASKQYWSDKQDARHRHSDERWLRMYADELLAFLPHGGVLLDVGCGACQVTTHLAAAYDLVKGIDFSDSMLDAARRRIAELGLRHVTVAQGDATQFPSCITSADVILAYGVVQYLDPLAMPRFLSECERILTPDGAVCLALVPDARFRRLWYAGALSTPRPSWLGMIRRRLQAEVRWWRAKTTGEHLWDGIGRWFEPEELAATCAAAGFTAEIRHAWFYEYRVHVLLRRKGWEID